MRPPQQFGGGLVPALTSLTRVRLILASLRGTEWYLVGVSLSLTMLNIFFVCLLIICVSSLEKFLFGYSAHFYLRLFVGCFVCVCVCLYINRYVPLAECDLQNFLSHDGFFALVY